MAWVPSLEETVLRELVRVSNPAIIHGCVTEADKMDSALFLDAMGRAMDGSTRSEVNSSMNRITHCLDGIHSIKHGGCRGRRNSL